MRGLVLRFALVSALALAGMPGAGAVPVPVGASANVELIAQIPDAQLMGARIVGNLMYATGTAGLRIYDLSNPELPVLVGALPVEIFSNEDVSVSASRKLVFISSDQTGNAMGGSLIVVDVRDPRTPTPVGFLAYNAANGFNTDGVGHIANCIADCAQYLYVTGANDGRIWIIDVSNPASPRFVKSFVTAAGSNRTGSSFKLVHDVNTAPDGTVWVTGTGGIAKINVASPASPVDTAVRTTTAQNNTYNQFVMHNSLVKGSTLLVTEEDWENINCRTTMNLQSRPEGSFQTWQINTSSLTPLDEWYTELSSVANGRMPVTTFCSSHWFDYNRNDIVAVGWYQQGVRFLDISNPSDIRQVGYYIPAWEAGGLGISQAIYAPGRDDIVYGLSLTSGLVVLKLVNGGRSLRTVEAPVLDEWFAQDGGVLFERFAPDPRFGYACAIAR